MALIGIISDTHGLLRPEALAALQGAEHILHAGDIGSPDIVARLEEIAPVTAIRGNIDVAPWASVHPETVAVDLFGLRVFIIHDRHDLDFDPSRLGYDIVVSGHSHRASIETVGGVLYLNPGSAGPRRFKLPVTLATLRTRDRPLSATIHPIV